MPAPDRDSLRCLQRTRASGPPSCPAPGPNGRLGHGPIVTEGPSGRGTFSQPRLLGGAWISAPRRWEAVPLHAEHSLSFSNLKLCLSLSLHAEHRRFAASMGDFAPHRAGTVNTRPKPSSLQTALHPGRRSHQGKGERQSMIKCVSIPAAGPIRPRCCRGPTQQPAPIPPVRIPFLGPHPCTGKPGRPSRVGRRNAKPKAGCAHSVAFVFGRIPLFERHPLCLANSTSSVRGISISAGTQWEMVTRGRSRSAPPNGGCFHVTIPYHIVRKS
jgi:hypothetical protein